MNREINYVGRKLKKKEGQYKRNRQRKEERRTTYKRKNIRKDEQIKKTRTEAKHSCKINKDKRMKENKQVHKTKTFLSHLLLTCKLLCVT